VVVVERHLGSFRRYACVYAIRALLEQIYGEQPLSVLARHDFSQRGLTLRNGQRLPGVTDANIEIEFVKACLDLDSAGRVAQHFESLHRVVEVRLLRKQVKRAI
jgi:hypothetical protein